MKKNKKIELQSEKRCFVCGSENVELHHIFTGQTYRKLCEEDGLVVYLCPMHHRISNNSAHMSKEFRLELQQMGQRAYMEHHSLEDWMGRYKVNYLAK